MKLISKVATCLGFLAALMGILSLYLSYQSQNAGEIAQQLARLTCGITAILVLSASLWLVLSTRTFSRRIKELTSGNYPFDTSRKDELTPLVEKLNQMGQEVDEVEDAKKQFFSHAVHELKGPLASMRESILLLMDPSQGPLSPAQKRLLEIHLRTSKRLFVTLSDLADLSRMEVRAMDYFMADQEVSALIEPLVAKYDSQLRNRKITLQVKLPDGALHIRADAVRLRQAISHLLDNAIKFSPRGTVIHLNARYFSELPVTAPPEIQQRTLESTVDLGFVLISVTDRGPGVPEQEKEKIFQKYYQVNAENQTYRKGLGIGLTLSRMIAEAHGGAVWIEDNPEGGARFLILFPGRFEEKIASRVASAC
jgi:signal transduction histidine kinase